MASEDSNAPCVWIATTVNNINVIEGVIRKEYTPQWRERQSSEDVEWSKRMVQETDLGWKRGELLTKEQIGSLWYYNSKTEYYTAPFISGGGYPLVSEAAKSVLEQFDLGDTTFHPLTLMDSTENQLTTSERYYFQNVCNKRSMGNYDVLGPEGDIRSPLDNIGNGICYHPRSKREAELVVIPEVLGGPDL